MTSNITTKSLTSDEKAARTATWAKTMTKVVIAQNNTDGPRWHVVNFLGPGKKESRGIVDLLAIRKNHVEPALPLKRGDLFDVVLIQVKGGSAPLPTEADRVRMRAVGEAYKAKAILLSEWVKGAKAVFSKLEGDDWVELSSPKDFAVIFGRRKTKAGSSSVATPSPAGVAAAKKAWATRRSATAMEAHN
jgi:hypothetical protein